MPGICPAAKVALARTGLSYVSSQAFGSVFLFASRLSQQVVMTTLLIICDANEPEMPWKANRSLSLTQSCQE